MEINLVCVLGGSGFVGRRICHALAAEGYRARVATRDRERAKEQLILLPTVDVAVADVHDPSQLAALVRGAEAVINLVGVLHDGRGHATFQAAHVELTRKVVAACRESGVSRLLHMSALGADPAGPSRYQRTKGEAERIVRESGLAWTIFRPSVIFGPGDGFINLFARLLRLAPVVPLARPDTRFQPVYVEDVAQAFVKSLGDLASAGKSYDLCGPRAYRLRELVDYVGQITGRRRWIIGLNDSLSYLQALAMEMPPLKQVLRSLDMLMTRDNYYSMRVDNVCNCEFPFGIAPAALEAVAPSYLGNRTPRAHYGRYRGQAGRDDA
ncbi:MAG TPA: complex I NDUFA9 subunit family protein [Burkholderiales bacterium]|nr:complex I NDUFA9 subunit family protein [Burkholderiales bacterium]